MESTLYAIYDKLKSTLIFYYFTKQKRKKIIIVTISKNNFDIIFVSLFLHFCFFLFVSKIIFLLNESQISSCFHWVEYHINRRYAQDPQAIRFDQTNIYPMFLLFLEQNMQWEPWYFTATTTEKNLFQNLFVVNTTRRLNIFILFRFHCKDNDLEQKEKKTTSNKLWICFLLRFKCILCI